MSPPGPPSQLRAWSNPANSPKFAIVFCVLEPSKSCTGDTQYPGRRNLTLVRPFDSCFPTFQRLHSGPQLRGGWGGSTLHLEIELKSCLPIIPTEFVQLCGNKRPGERSVFTQFPVFPFSRGSIQLFGKLHKEKSQKKSRISKEFHET